MFNKNEVRALTRDSSLTFVLPIRIAIQLGVENRDLLEYHVDGERLIVEKIVDKEYYSTSNGQTTAMARDESASRHNAKFSDARSGEQTQYSMRSSSHDADKRQRGQETPLVEEESNTCQTFPDSIIRAEVI